MLDPNALAQLNQLKTNIQSTKDYAEGTVAATSGRFGFVRTDDGRDVFLAPEKMDRLLHGDRVKVSVSENDKGKLEGELEKLLSSDVTKFVGQYRVKGAGHFVVPSGTQFNRWIFVPPKNRKNSKEGDFVIAKLSRHPYNDGKAQAHVMFRVGQPDDAFIEHKYTKAKYDLNYRTTDAYLDEAKAIDAQVEAQAFGDIEDLSKLPFVTIDSASTLDMDDALYAEELEDGFKLYVAIAAPSLFIKPGSAMAKQAQQCGQSVYLLGGTIPMLPAQLAHHTFSLEEDKQRPALVAQFKIDKSGAIQDQEFSHAQIKSHHKLSYELSAQFLAGDNDAVPESAQGLLSTLKRVSEARQNWRSVHALVNEDQGDYEYTLNERGHITAARLRARTAAHQIVEECMIATNMAAGQFLAQASAGLHGVHKGFREDRIGEVHALLKEESCDADNINELEGHIKLLNTLASDEGKSHLIPALRRMMQGSELSAVPGPHLGLGAAHYATITSPIRRFADTFNHWCISAVLAGESAPTLNEETLAELNETLRKGRQADRELQQWLICLFVKSKVGERASGQIRIVTQQGFGVRILESGIEGFVLFDRKTEKNFDAKRLILTAKEREFQIGDMVDIKITNVDFDKRRIAFSLNETE